MLYNIAHIWTNANSLVLKKGLNSKEEGGCAPIFLWPADPRVLSTASLNEF